MQNNDQPTGRDRYIQRGQQMNQVAASKKQRMRQMRFDTIAVHGIYDAQAVLDHQGSIIEPAFLSTSQHFENSDHLEAALAYEMPSWTYTRIANPTLHYLETTLALLEGYGFEGETSAFATASGMAAIVMATQPLLAAQSSKPPNIVVGAKCYGGTFTLFTERYQNERGIEVRWVRDLLDVDEWARYVDADTRFVYGEMPSNPALAVFDIAAVAAIAHAQEVPLIVDSTVATPALLRPFQHGADIVVHSVSKSMASSGFAIAGAVIARHDIPSRWLDEAMRRDFATQVKLLPLRDFGAALSPFSALMVLNDLRTLRHKMDHLSSSSQQIAAYLAAHPKVEAAHYPGLPSSPGHDLARQYMTLVDSETDEKRYGHLLSFDVRGGAPAARQVLDRLNLIRRATDLGRIKSCATIPAISTHQQQGEGGRALAGIPANQIRLCVGAEHPLDLIADLEQALAAV